MSANGSRRLSIGLLIGSSAIILASLAYVVWILAR